MKLKETKQDRSLKNHQKYLNEWDKYEQKIQDHFTDKILYKYGSMKAALAAIARKEENIVPSVAALAKETKPLR